ncbi:MAG: ABC transporter substrate-binding protein [Opitutaceae bacterium]|nr:ABC transporter substrate-binding protein [Opitutaceae bacterium]
MIQPPPPAPRLSASRSRPLRLGWVSLTDAAPLVAAQEQGFFARHGLHVELRREIGWATIRDKVIYGELDAAPAPAPMLWSVQLGLGCPPCDALTALVLSLNGNAITLSRALWEAGVRDGASLRDYARTRRARQPLTFGVVFPFSSHHLLLSEWLRSAGLDPANDVRIVVVPPAQMFRNLAAHTIDGFCAGEPWNTLAVREGAGWCPAWSAALRPGHVEKVLLVTQRFAETRATEHAAIVRALAEAALWCDEPHHRERLAEVLAAAPYLNLPASVIAPALLGRFDCGHGRIEAVPDFHVFHRGEAGVPAVDKARALQRALGAAGLLPPAAAKDADLPRRLFREDLHREIISANLHLA